MIHVILINNVINIVQTGSCHTLAFVRELGPWLDKLGFFYFSADCKVFLKTIEYCYETVRTVGEKEREREKERVAWSSSYHPAPPKERTHGPLTGLEVPGF